MKKFTFYPQNDKFINHNLPSEILIQVIFNDEDEYDLLKDVYEMFEFRGNKIVVKWYADYDEIAEIEDYNHIRSILCRAWKWYKSQVYIDKKEFIAGAMETEQYILQPSKLQSDSWVLTDKENMISIIFENHKFNETQKITELNYIKPEQIAILSRILREMGDCWQKIIMTKLFSFYFPKTYIKTFSFNLSIGEKSVLIYPFVTRYSDA